MSKVDDNLIQSILWYAIAAVNEDPDRAARHEVVGNKHSIKKVTPGKEFTRGFGAALRGEIALDKGTRNTGGLNGLKVACGPVCCRGHVLRAGYCGDGLTA